MLHLRYAALLVMGSAPFIAACGGKSGDSSEHPAAGAGGTSEPAAGKGGGSAMGGAAGTTSGTAGSSGSAGRGGTGGSTGGTSGSSGSGGVGGPAQGGGGSGAGGSGATSGDGSGGSSDGGTSGGGMGGTAAGAAGTGMCGPCPGAACGPPFMAYVTAPAGGMITNLTAEAAGFEIDCYPNGPGNPGCQWVCQSSNFVGDGDHTVTFSAAGYDPTEVSFTVVRPTNCGCCGCPCHTETFNDVMLMPNGDEPGACCADLTSDASNCGSCGTVCSTAFHCAGGGCVGPQGP